MGLAHRAAGGRKSRRLLRVLSLPETRFPRGSTAATISAEKSAP